MQAEIIAVGSEMLTPYRVDTNSLALTAELNKLGVEVAFKTILGDDLQQLIAAAKIALRRADLVLFSGGLGPTEDDLTREAVAGALGLGMTRVESIAADLRERFNRRGMVIAENNYRQANVLETATVLPNANGTAPGQWLVAQVDGRQRIVVLLPGPPKELTALFAGQVRERLRAVLPAAHIATGTLRMAVVPESEVDARTAPIYGKYGDVQTTILSTQGEIQLHFLCSKPTLDEAKARVAEVLDRCEHEMQAFVFSNNNDSLEQVVLQRLAVRHKTLAVAESCTGGLLGQRMTSVAGSSRSFVGGAIVYSNALKTSFAGVPESLLQAHGAVSEAVASALAQGIRQRTGADIGIGITGVAGPDGGTDTKPVGLVYVGLSDAEGTTVRQLNLHGDRERVRWMTTQHALVMLRNHLV